MLDMDSSVSPTYGDQEGTAYNGHFACTCYHPLFVFNQFGDLERSALRSGNVHSAHGWKEVVEPVVARYRGKFKRRYFRADAAFANPEVYEFLEAEGFKYAIRLPANQILQEKIGYLLKRPVGRPPIEVRRYYASFSYQAQSWKTARRVAAKVEWHSRLSFIPASGSSLPTCHARPSASSPSTIGAALRSNGLRKARTPSSGRGSSIGARRAAESPMKSVCAPRRQRYGRELTGTTHRRSQSDAMVDDLTLRQMPVKTHQAVRRDRYVIGQFVEHGAPKEARKSCGLHGMRQDSARAPSRKTSVNGSSRRKDVPG